MLRYLFRRIVFALFLVFAVSSLSLVLTRLAPGDYVTDSAGVSGTAAARELARTRYGLGRPLAAQYGEWLSRAVRLDFGRSLAFNRPVSELVPERSANTLLLAVTALAIATLLGIPLGTITGSGRAGSLSSIVRAGSVVLLSAPPMLTSLLLVFVAAKTGWFPIGGMRPAAGSTGGLFELARHMAVPVLALALPLAATFERLQAQAMRDATRQPFVIATLARGIPTHRVMWIDAFKVSLQPIAAVYGLVIASLLSGSFIVEMITAWPGLGRLMLDALRARDIYLIAGCATAGSVFLAAGTLVSDALLALVDPRTAP